MADMGWFLVFGTLWGVPFMAGVAACGMSRDDFKITQEAMFSCNHKRGSKLVSENNDNSGPTCRWQNIHLFIFIPDSPRRLVTGTLLAWDVNKDLVKFISHHIRDNMLRHWLTVLMEVSLPVWQAVLLGVFSRAPPAFTPSWCMVLRMAAGSRECTATLIGPTRVKE